MLLSHVLIATNVVMLLPYVRPSLAFNRYGQLRSISGMICQLKPFGHFFMSLGNLLIFLILSMEFQLVAWLYWVAFQLILSFDVDEYPLAHFLSLMTYIGLLIYFWYEACAKHGLWTEAIPLFASSGLFALLILFNLARFGPKGPWPYQTAQSLIEIAWVCCSVYLIYKYEELLQGKGVTAVAIV